MKKNPKRVNLILAIIHFILSFSYYRYSRAEKIIYIDNPIVLPEDEYHNIFSLAFLCISGVSLLYNLILVMKVRK